MNKRLASLVIACALSASISLTGCGGSAEQNSEVAPGTGSPGQSSSAATPAEGGASESAAEGDIEVDEGLLSTEVRLPMSLFMFGKDESAKPPTQEELQAAVDKEGRDIEVTVNDDQTVTYRMSRGEYDRFKDELKKSMDTSIQETINKEANIYKSVTYNDDMSEFEIVVDRKALEDSWSFAGLGFLITAGFYQAFLGLDESERFVILNYVDEKTGEVFDTVDSRTLDEEN